MHRFAVYRPQIHGTVDGAVVVRLARADDAAAIVAVDATREPRPREYLAKVETRLARPDAIHVVAEVEGLAVGTSSLMVWPEHTDSPQGWYVSGITVVPGWRRRRIADRMMAFELARLDRAGLPAWSVVNLANRASLDLHARHGFVEVAKAPQFAGITFAGGTGLLLRRAALTL